MNIKSFFFRVLVLGIGVEIMLLGNIFGYPLPKESPRKRTEKWLHRLSRVLRHELGLVKKGLKGRKMRGVEPNFVYGAYKEASFTLEKGIPVLRVFGNPYEMGYQQGKLVGKQIKILNQFYLDLLMDTKKKKKPAFAFIKKLEPYIPKDYKEEMKGIADGAGIPYEEVLFGHTFLDLFHSQIVACSTVGIMPFRSVTGETLFGRNLDFPSLGFVHKFSIIIVYHPKGKPVIVSVGWPGLGGVLTGMNEYGLSLGMMSIQFEDFHWGGFPMFWLFRHILETCKTVPEAIKLLQKTRLSVASNLMLADPKSLAVAELLPSNKQFRFPSQQGVIHSTNHFQHPKIRKFIPSGTYFSSFVRSHIISHTLGKAPQKVDWKFVRKILQKVCIKGINLQSMVIVPSRKAFYLAIGSTESAKKDFTYLEWKDLVIQRKEKKWAPSQK
ncbi:MAG: hypothetical protein D6785_02275 [Planctomycetota bacterium]|nr:MAG: hypothetical protein D6785_02275 [Planctomycetota bacterium]